MSKKKIVFATIEISDIHNVHSTEKFVAADFPAIDGYWFDEIFSTMLSPSGNAVLVGMIYKKDRADNETM